MSSTIGAQYTGSFSLASQHGESGVAHMDDAISGDIAEKADDVSRLRRMFEMLRKHALSEEESIRLIKEAAEGWTKKI